MRESDFLKPNLSQNPMETRARMCERECEWVCEYERAQHPSRPLFKEKMARAPEERQATTAMEPLEKVGPRNCWPWLGQPVGSAGPRVGNVVPPLARCFLNGYELWKYDARPKVCSKRCPNYFSQRILKLRKYFWYFFCKKGKVLEKIPACRKQFWKFQTCSGEKK